MEEAIKSKIIDLDTLITKVAELKGEGNVVVQSHGVFDLIHPGMIKHLNEARQQGDILIITIIKDKDILRGSGRPIFPEHYRAENVASLQQVDYVCTVDNERPYDCINRIKPDIFAKGQSYKERDRIIHEKIFNEEKELFFEKTKLFETNGFTFSTSHIVNNFLDIYPKEVKSFLKNFSNSYDFNYIVEKLNTLKDMKVLLIGDGIIDEYCYCSSMGKSPKAQLLVHKYLNSEIFAGGAFAIANHVAGICGSVKLVSLLGKKDSKEDFIINNLKPNVETKFFYREDGPTVLKKRYINQYQNQKIFEINDIDDTFIPEEQESEVIDYLKSEIDEYDLVLVSDFGHGFISKKMINIIETLSKKVAVNAQTNGANTGYNLITKYSNTGFICLDSPEARLATEERFADIEDVARILMKKINPEYLFITMGASGSLCITEKGDINRTPVFSTKVVDIIGAGDAFFAYTAPCFATGMPVEVISFIGNAVGALAVQIVGNKKPVEKPELLEFIHTVLR